MNSFINYLKNNKKGIYNIWYKNNEINNENQNKLGKWMLNDNLKMDDIIEVILIDPKNEKSIFRIEMGETILINFILGSTITQMYYLEENDKKNNFRVIESEEKFITIHTVYFKHYEFQKIMHFIK